MEKQALIVRLSSLGDVIFNIPLAAVFKANGYKVTWITSEKGFGVLENNPFVDEVILAPFVKWKKQSFIKNLKEYLTILKYVRTKKFDVAVDPQGLIKSFLWLFPCKAKRKIVSNMARQFSFLAGNEKIHFELDKIMEIHAVKQYLNYAQHLKLDNADKIEVALPPATEEIVSKLDDLMINLDSSKPIITMSPATTWPTKHWEKDNWKEVVSKLENDYNIVFTGTSNDIDLINCISGGKHLNLAGKTNLLELAELFRRSDLVISLDSGSTHLAWATKHPKIISIFCSTPPTRYAPIGEKDKYIALVGNLDCQKLCHRRHCPKKTNDCTFLPTVEEVLKAVDTLLPVYKS